MADKKSKNGFVRMQERRRNEVEISPCDYKPSPVKFKQIKKGGLFVCKKGGDLHYFMKTNTTLYANCVDVENGSVQFIDPYTFVVSLVGMVKIMGNGDE